MLIAEILIRNNYVKLQIDELKKYLIGDSKVTNINDALTKLYELEDQNQRYKILVDKANREIKVEIGTSKVPVSTAIELRRNTSRKIDILTELISANKESLDIFNLLAQRAKLVEEYIMISKAINISDWSHEIE